MKHFLFSFILLVSLQYSSARAIETAAKYAIVIDDQTGAAIYAKEADTKMHPASMTKMMTVHLIFKQLKEGRLTLDQTFPVSENAWRTQGSKMFVELGNTIPLEELIRGIIIQSGNDACVVVAEGIAGTEQTFAGLMNDEAKALGMRNTHFTNSTGWPDPEHLTTARDLAILAQRTIHDSGDYYQYYSEKEYTYHGIRQYNRNLLLGSSFGVDGLKTGHTEEAGYGITASGMNVEGRRVIVVVHGLSSEKERAEEAASLMGYAFGAFENVNLGKHKPALGTLAVHLGAEDAVPLVLGETAGVTLPRAGRDQVTYTLKADEPLLAPVKAGEAVGMLTVHVDGMEDQTLQVYTGSDIAKAGFGRKLKLNLKHLLGV